MRRGSELLLVVLAGCWDKAAVDIGGMYHVDSHVASRCTTDTPVPTPYAYVRLVSRSGYTLEACASADAMGCFVVGEFVDPVQDEGWRRREASIAIGGEISVCRLQLVEAFAALTDDAGTSLVIETTTYADFLDANSPLCTIEEARRRGTTMMCDGHELISATRLMLQP